ncbi:DUF1002 domain-containing protein [Enterococcus xiangfangensis]|uniref:DUF1002 domain-containing protein n=1 Tax=Enterococcus xiangfangensis TaxID=1296537 RepID=A0ABU3FDG1_9ENTE|nr:DUF1002 domain-containing protein [Enterococcus xiangfangensis]MDT2760689.1 DUF1002 domain-containing protein [Enterococcus xiangfangensis]
MKLHKYILLAGAGLFLSAGLIGQTNAQAASDDGAINERWGKPTFVAGAGLSQQQLTETMDTLKISQDTVKMEQATGADLVKYLGYGSGDDSVMLSSVVVNREDQGKGINVEILTPQNITQITADQYKNPLVTAGITDATVKVASVVKVTGESALTGVYKAFEANGETVDPERAQLAQTELDTTSDVAQSVVDNANEQSQNQDLSDNEKEKADEAYKAQLNQALVDIKKDLAELKEQQGELATKEDVEKIVNDALEKNNLSQYVTKDDINKLITLAQQYQTTDGVLDKESIEQLDKISDDFKGTVNKLSDQLGKFGDSLKGTLEDNQGFFANLWQQIKDFFSGLTK